MSFNYRVLQNVNDHELVSDDERIWYAIHEVYYDENGVPNASSSEPIYPYGTTLEELKESIELYLTALDKPTLKIENDVYVEIV